MNHYFVELNPLSERSTSSSSSGGAALNIANELATGPIFVPKLQCPSDPETPGAYESCLNENLLGLSECEHTQDIAVRCEGEWYRERFSERDGEF